MPDRSKKNRPVSLLTALLLTSTSSAAWAQSHTQKKSADSSEKMQARCVDLWSQVQGACTITYTKTAIRMDSPSRNFVLLLKAPKWQATSMNPKTRLVHICPPSQWKPNDVHTFGWLRPSAATGLIPKSFQETSLEGLKCRLYKMEIRQKIANPTHAWERLIIKEADYWVAEDKVYPQEAAKCFERALALSSVGAIPLKLETTNYGMAKKKDELKLVKVQVKTVPKSLFEVPSDYKTVKSIQDISGQASQEMVDMFK
ncbi:MAG: hypothetical protein SFV17_26195 [Candidatus Obscuribacter sp.]|nr:hypothetical protein [Candidatus Melainabacteria bacterium]MDX1990211.1 hypothetical protein [Candidatus Obscuribacter sp.]